ncbi:hypothetical protein BGZ76_001779 [Entomortierella beljakovae]|nr:hypothetical protein BGZ76_001779 [Entomortierella beljakovae]
MCASRLFAAAALVAVFSMGMVEAGIGCKSPSGTAQTGDTVSLTLGDTGIIAPWAKDIYSVSASIRCSSDDREITSFGMTNGDSWTIPSSLYGACPNNQVYVYYSGNNYDIFHWLHFYKFSTSCGTLNIIQPPPPPTTNPPKPITTKPPPVVEPTVNPTKPPDTDTTTKAPNPQPTTTTPDVIRTTVSVTFTPTVTVIPTVVSGTTIFITTATITQINATFALPTESVTTATGPGTPQLSGLPNDPNSPVQPQQKSLNVPAATLGAVAGVAAIMLIVFGLVVTRNRRRQRKQMDREMMEKNGFNEPDSTYAEDFASSAYVIPSPVPARQSSPIFAAGGSGDYSYAAATAAATAGAGAGAAAASTSTYPHNRRIDPDAGKYIPDENLLLPFPVPSATSEALKSKYELANRASVATQESLTDTMSTRPSAPNTGAIAIATAAAAVNQQMSLRQEFERDEEEQLNYLYTGSPTNSHKESHTTISSPSVAASVAPSTSAVGRASYATAEFGNSSAYDTTHSRSSAYDTAMSPSLSSRSFGSQELSFSPMTSHDIPVPPLPNNTEWRNGGTESSHIRDLIRNVLDD